MNVDRFSPSSIKAKDSKLVVTKNAQEYVHFEVKFDLTHPYLGYTWCFKGI